MQNNIFNKMNVSSRLLILFLLVFSLMITGSLRFILLFTTFVLILLILNYKSVKYYLDLLKKFKFVLLFIFVTYIIILGNFLNTLIFLYKIILIFLLIDLFLSTVKFETLTNGIKTLLKPLENKLKINKIALNVSLFIYFLIYYTDSKKEILLKGSTQKFNIKNNILPRLFLTNYKLKKIETDLKLKFYSPKFELNNRKSNIAVGVFVFVLMLVIFKEVIS